MSKIDNNIELISNLSSQVNKLNLSKFYQKVQPYPVLHSPSSIQSSSYTNSPISPPPTTSLVRSIAAQETASTPVQSDRFVVVHTILIVDDNIINQKVAARMLNSSQYVCECVASGREALKLLQIRCIDLVLMDLQMPEMDGFECTKKIRGMEKDGKLLHSNKAQHQRLRVPIIAITASEGADLLNLCQTAGMDACLFKPCTKAQMKQTVAEWINK